MLHEHPYSPVSAERGLNLDKLENLETLENLEKLERLKLVVFRPLGVSGLQTPDRCLMALVLEMCFCRENRPDTSSLLKVNYTLRVLKNSLLSASIMLAALAQILQRCGMIHSG